MTEEKGDKVCKGRREERYRKERKESIVSKEVMRRKKEILRKENKGKSGEVYMLRSVEEELRGG